jgi:hypothetical protein
MSGKVARPTSHREIPVRGKTSSERRHPAGFVGFSAGGTPAFHFSPRPLPAEIQRNPKAMALKKRINRLHLRII